ncbi:MAG: hypothetical protein WCF59_14890 [Desulfobaccales bacterium]
MANDNIPDEMLQRGREPDPDFPLEEDLFVRFQTVENNKVSISDIKFPDQSVNRSRYSEAIWILIPMSKFRNWGYGVIKVQDIPREPRIPSGKTNQCQIEHCPLEQNYSHCEIRAYKNGIRVNNNNKDKRIGLQFRLEFIRKIEIRKFPDYPYANE